MQHEALKSLYGGKKALSGMVGGQAREQTVLTPDWLLGAIRAWAPIGLDPCTTQENPTGARQHLGLSVEGRALQQVLSETEDQKMKKHLKAQLKPHLLAGGLSVPWNTLNNECVYVNPPYDMLREWMAKCSAEACRPSQPQIYLLAPFRPHRHWFIKHTEGYTVVSLAPFAFKGHKQSFPAPLCLVCYNAPATNLGKYETGRWRCA